MGGVGTQGVSQKRAQGFELGSCLVGVSGGGEHLGDYETGAEDLVRLVLVRRGVDVLHVEAKLRQDLVRLADLGVGVACVVGAVEDVRVGRRQIPAVVGAYSIEE